MYLSPVGLFFFVDKFSRCECAHNFARIRAQDSGSECCVSPRSMLGRERRQRGKIEISFLRCERCEEQKTSEDTGELQGSGCRRAANPLRSCDALAPPRVLYSTLPSAPGELSCASTLSLPSLRSWQCPPLSPSPPARMPLGHRRDRRARRPVPPHCS